MHNSFCPRSRFAGFLLCWFTGLLLGILAAAKADCCVVALMRPILFQRVSIVLMLLWGLLPLWITAWSVMIQITDILFFLLLCRCFFFGFFLWLSLRAMGSAGWLTVPLCRFSDWLSLAVFCWLVLRCLGGTECRRRDILMAFVITVLGVVTDYLLVSPFLAGL